MDAPDILVGIRGVADVLAHAVRFKPRIGKFSFRLMPRGIAKSFQILDVLSDCVWRWKSQVHFLPHFSLYLEPHARVADALSHEGFVRVAKGACRLARCRRAAPMGGTHPG